MIKVYTPEVHHELSRRCIGWQLKKSHQHQKDHLKSDHCCLVLFARIVSLIVTDERTFGYEFEMEWIVSWKGLRVSKDFCCGVDNCMNEVHLLVLLGVRFLCNLQKDTKSSPIDFWPCHLRQKDDVTFRHVLVKWVDNLREDRRKEAKRDVVVNQKSELRTLIRTSRGYGMLLGKKKKNRLRSLSSLLILSLQYFSVAAMSASASSGIKVTVYSDLA